MLNQVWHSEEPRKELLNIHQKIIFLSFQKLALLRQSAKQLVYDGRWKYKNELREFFLNNDMSNISF